MWKCKAKRYVNSGEDFPEKSEADERWKERIDFLDQADEEIGKQIGKYDEDHNDAVYGGYERPDDEYDKQRFDPAQDKKVEFLDDGSYIELFQFSNGNRLVTDGYDLLFVSGSGEGETCVKIAMNEGKLNDVGNYLPTGIQYLKSTDDALYFVNFDNRTCRLCDDAEMTGGEIQLCLNSLVDTTFSTGPDNNRNGDLFYKFKGSNTVLFTIGSNLYCRFGNKGRKLVKLA